MTVVKASRNGNDAGYGFDNRAILGEVHEEVDDEVVHL
jgi:hypothetical protein